MSEVILTVETIGDFEPQIDKSAYAVTYEITPKYGDISKMTNREYEDLRAWYRFQMKKYLLFQRVHLKKFQQ